MMKIFSIVFLLFTLTCFSSAADPSKLYIRGMSCSSCAKSISTELKKAASVEDVVISLETGELDIVYKKDATPLTEAQIKDSLKQAGDYELAKTPLNAAAATKTK